MLKAHLVKFGNLCKCIAVPIHLELSSPGLSYSERCRKIAGFTQVAAMKAEQQGIHVFGRAWCCNGRLWNRSWVRWETNKEKVKRVCGLTEDPKG